MVHLRKQMQQPSYLNGPYEKLDLGIGHSYKQAVARVKPVVGHEGVPCDGVLEQRLQDTTSRGGSVEAYGRVNDVMCGRLQH